MVQASIGALSIVFIIAPLHTNLTIAVKPIAKSIVPKTRVVLYKEACQIVRHGVAWWRRNW